MLSVQNAIDVLDNYGLSGSACDGICEAWQTLKSFVLAQLSHNNARKDFDMSRAELKIYDKGEFFLIKRPRSTHHRALCFTADDAETICAVLNAKESRPTVRQNPSVQQTKVTIPLSCKSCGLGCHTDVHRGSCYCTDRLREALWKPSLRSHNSRSPTCQSPRRAGAARRYKT